MGLCLRRRRSRHRLCSRCERGRLLWDVGATLDRCCVWRPRRMDPLVGRRPNPRQRGLTWSVRTPRGRDILAACGQLKSETEKLRARARLMLEAGIGAEGLYAVGGEA